MFYVPSDNNSNCWQRTSILARLCMCTMYSGTSADTLGTAWCPHFRGSFIHKYNIQLGPTIVSWCPYFKGVLIEGFHCMVFGITRWYINSFDVVIICLCMLSTPPHTCQVSLPLVSAFGQDSKSAEWLTAFLTEIVTFNLSVWSSEDKLCVTSVELFNSLVKLNTRRWVGQDFKLVCNIDRVYLFI